MMDGLALGKTTPGPLIMLVAFVGFVGGYLKAIFGPNLPLAAGATAATVVTWFTFLPSFVFILAGGPIIESTRQDLKLTAPLTAITAAVVGVILNLAVYFGYHVIWPKGPQGRVEVVSALIAIAAGIALFRFKRGVMEGIAGFAIPGLIAKYLFSGPLFPCHSPRGDLGPPLQLILCPSRRLVCVAGGARIGNLELVGCRRRDEFERVTADVYVRDGLLDLGHVAVDALSPSRSGLMVCMLLNGSGMGAIGRTRAVAGETNCGRRFEEIRIVRASVWVMATGTRYAMGVHRTLHEIIALHPVLVCGAIGEVSEGCLVGFVFL